MGASDRPLAAALLTLTLMGCGGNDAHPHVPVSGTVTLNGEPLADAQVSFQPTGATPGIGAEARTGPDGRYKLTDRRGKPGTEAGAYNVTVSKRVMPDGSPMPAEDKTQPIRSSARESLPPHYSDPARTRLQVVVPEHSGTIDLPLTIQKR